MMGEVCFCERKWGLVEIGLGLGAISLSFSLKIGYFQAETGIFTLFPWRTLLYWHVCLKFYNHQAHLLSCKTPNSTLNTRIHVDIADKKNENWHMKHMRKALKDRKVWWLLFSRALKMAWFSSYLLPILKLFSLHVPLHCAWIYSSHFYSGHIFSLFFGLLVSFFHQILSSILSKITIFRIDHFKRDSRVKIL